MAAAHPFLEWPGPLPFAHRGGACEAPENTIPAFQRAVDLGFVYLETDVQLTRDGVVVAFHDDDLERTCGIPARISDSTWSEVAAARVDGREPIPRLDDLFDAFPDVRLNIDCKSDAVLEPLATVLRRRDVLDRICVGSFSDRRLRRLRQRLGPTLCTSTGPAETAALVLAGRNVGRAQAAQVPVRQGRVVIVTPRFIRLARRRGMQVHVWTIDDAAEMERLLDLGVDGLMTDRPAVLREVLERRGQWHSA